MKGSAEPSKFRLSLANLLLFSRKLAKYYKGIPSSFLPSPLFLCINYRQRYLAILLWIYGNWKEG
jgi:hypothetical protein